MKVVITIQHPAHVHFYRNAIEHLQTNGHEVHVFARDRPMALTLLDRYDIEYEVLTHKFDSKIKMALGQLKYELNLLRKVRRIDPDVITAIGGLAIAHVSRLVNAQSILFTDTEHATLTNSLAFPFADKICTPDCYEGDLGPKQIRYPGYHELAYLDPNRFEPDPTVLSDIGIDPEDRFVMLRLVDWNAAHDVGDSGFSDVESVVTALEETGVNVYITAEGGVPETIERCEIPVEPHQIHHLMYYADLFIGEGATMATESAVLGTPGIFVSTIRLGYTAELEERYGLLRNFDGENRQVDAVQAGISILEEYEQSMWDRRRERMLADKIDTTEFILQQITSALPSSDSNVPSDVPDSVSQ